MTLNYLLQQIEKYTYFACLCNIASKEQYILSISIEFPTTIKILECKESAIIYYTASICKENSKICNNDSTIKISL